MISTWVEKYLAEHFTTKEPKSITGTSLIFDNFMDNFEFAASARMGSVAIVVYGEQARTRNAVISRIKETVQETQSHFLYYSAAWKSLAETLKSLKPSTDHIILAVIQKGRMSSEVDSIPKWERDFISASAGQPVIILLADEGISQNQSEDLWLAQNLEQFKKYGLDFENLPQISCCLANAEEYGIQVRNQFKKAQLASLSQLVGMIHQNRKPFMEIDVNDKHWFPKRTSIVFEFFQVFLFFALTLLTLCVVFYFWEDIFGGEKIKEL